MITFSFGFSDSKPLIRVKDELDECLKNNIMIFASASNDAGRGPRTYPAEFDRVLCAYSATCEGGKSNINPLRGRRKISHQFMFVGEHVRPLWGLKKADRDKHPMGYKSGTSYATPVAVSIAAFMLGYIEMYMSDISWEVKPQSPEGIEQIFKCISEESNGYHFVNPTEDLFDTKKGTVKGDLMRELRWF